MSRKRNNKPSAKRKSAKNSNYSLQLEKDFYNAPAQLSAQFNKEIVGLKQAENKLKATFAKLKTQAQKARTKVKANAANKSMNLLSKQLAEMTKSIQTATQKQAKMAALKKVFNEFEKDWTKKAKQIKAKPKKMAKPKKSMTKSNPQALPAEQPHMDNFEETLENVSTMDSSAEIIS